MAIVIKEIHVQTVVEKKMIEVTDVSERLLQKIKQDVVSELRNLQDTTAKKKKER
ncbi:hypothetical protein [Bacteroides sp.]|uniref:hypothetical protein n=1 Tax=Bacteroides sp. TaxID=29523 RepID=UPI00263028AD|nr:hypothetical protein [Bacteroides sp.]MDD3038144.1 hypothetical protein [Bacteroides sp.]